MDEQGRCTARWRPKYGATDWLKMACTHLNVDWKELGDRGRHPEVVRTRELIGLVGIERFGVKVTDLADALGKSRDGVSQWVRRGEMRRLTDPQFAADVKALDLAASEDP